MVDALKEFATSTASSQWYRCCRGGGKNIAEHEKPVYGAGLALPAASLATSAGAATPHHNRTRQGDAVKTSDMLRRVETLRGRLGYVTIAVREPQ
jgi:hypothetical protein